VTLFDANAWLGSWPFAFLPNRDAAALAGALRRSGVERALVSSLSAVFAPEPGPANRELLAETVAVPSLIPLPIINPGLANWREELDRVAHDRRVRAVRWLPAYHNYRLTGRNAADCFAELVRRDLRLVITTRLIDERHEYFALRIKPLAVEALDGFLSARPTRPVLVTGLSRAELIALAPKHRRLLADTSWAEWDRSVEHLLRAASPGQLVFGSHTPFLILAASVAKIISAGLSRRRLEAIARGNLKRFLEC
jgi:uncharacterized protein